MLGESHLPMKQETNYGRFLNNSFGSSDVWRSSRRNVSTLRTIISEVRLENALQVEIDIVVSHICLIS